MSKKAPEKTMSIETRIYPVQDHGKVLARATVTLEDCFVVHGIQIMAGKENQPFVSMPSVKVGEKYKDICFPCTKEFREELLDSILGTFEQTMAELVQKHNQKPSQQEPEMSM